jgi:predicted lipoprotein with Yx(FWY)xxD motif
MRKAYAIVVMSLLVLLSTRTGNVLGAEPEIVLWTTPAKVDFWVPPGITVQSNPVVGLVFADPNGMPLYVFDCDRDLGTLEEKSLVGSSPRETCKRVLSRIKEPLKAAHSKCVEACADEHPPVLAVVSSVGKGDWSLVERDGGVHQWAYKGRPLYRYKHDDSPGYPYGADVGGVWAQATVSGVIYAPYAALLKAKEPAKEIGVSFPLAPGITVRKTPSGAVLADYRGMTLYSSKESRRHSASNPTASNPTERSDLLQWQPLRAGALATARGDWTIVRADEGILAWAYKGRPLYTCSGDARPGDQNCAAPAWQAFTVSDAMLTYKDKPQD